MSLPQPRTRPGSREARTHPDHPDRNLRGRTYTVPFARVWGAAAELASGGMRGWEVVAADEDTGLIGARARAPILGSVDHVEIRVSLDENALTRVDLTCGHRALDLGRNRRRIRRFLRLLDERVGGGPRRVLDPTPPPVSCILLFLGLLAACGPEGPPPPEAREAEPVSPVPTRNFQGRSYERHIVFLTFQGDSALLVPWSFSARTGPGGVEREVRGWLARGDTWDPFLSDRWEAPPNTAPWRILPHGPVKLVVGLQDALETIIYQEGGRSLEVNLGEFLVEWTGRRAQTYRVQEGSLVLSDRTVRGYVLDMSRAWATGDQLPGDWGILLSGDSLQLAMENLGPGSGPEGGSFTLWARVEFLDRQWQEVQLAWSEVRAFEAARRDVPMAWEVRSPGGEVTGTLTAVAPSLEVGEGEGPLLPVEALFQVAGTLTLDGVDFPVQGFIRHAQR